MALTHWVALVRVSLWWVCVRCTLLLRLLLLLLCCRGEPSTAHVT